MDPIIVSAIIVLVLSVGGVAGFFAWRHHEEYVSKHPVRAWLASFDSTLVRTAQRTTRTGAHGVRTIARGVFIYLPGAIINSANLPAHVKGRLETRRFRRPRPRTKKSGRHEKASTYIQAVVDHKRHMNQSRSQDTHIERE